MLVLLVRGAGMQPEEFLEKAKPIEMTINNHKVKIPAKVFKTGSLGWYLATKLHLPSIDDEMVNCQIGINITIIGTKKKKP